MLVVPESEVVIGDEAPEENGQLHRQKRFILLAKGLAFGKGLLIGKLAGFSLG
jgi:hypothetical protein